MADISETSDFPEGIYQIETTDPVRGGPPNRTTGAGIANIAAQELANRTLWLRDKVNSALARSGGQMSGPINMDGNNLNLVDRVIFSTGADYISWRTGEGLQFFENGTLVAQVGPRSFVRDDFMIGNTAASDLVRRSEFSPSSRSPSMIDQSLPNGLIIKAGYSVAESTSNNPEVIVTYGTAFPSTTVAVTIGEESSASGSSFFHAISTVRRERTRFGVVVRNIENMSLLQGTGFSWIAIGY